MNTSRPRNVGIHAMEIYFPKTYVSQSDLEVFDKAPKGKYTIGLEQTNLSFVDTYEDIGSVCLTALTNLLEKFNIDPKRIGRLEVGTETLVDKSKSIKTLLMQVFEKSGNTDIEGVTSQNACYGGTNAFFNTLAWVESSAWDGRLGVVIAADIAVYAKGPARPTGGAGAVALLVGPDAPIVINPIRATYMEHAYDFYKPDPRSEYPTVDGHHSIKCYLRALDECYKLLKSKLSAQLIDRDFNLSKVDHCCFHTPFGKMVHKSFCRLFYHDILNGKIQISGDDLSYLKATKDYDDKRVQSIIINASKAQWLSKVKPSLFLSENLGNIYTGALYGCLVSLVSDEKLNLDGKNILMFSYGSGLAASMFLLTVRGNLGFIQGKLKISERINRRIKLSPEEFDQIMDKRQKLYASNPPFNFESKEERLFEGSYYLERVDEKWRRFYKRVGDKQAPAKPAQGTGVARSNCSAVERLCRLRGQINSDN